MRRRISGEMRRRSIFILLLTGGMIFGHLSGSSDDLQLKRIRCSQNEPEIYNTWVHHTSILTDCAAKDLMRSYIRKCCLPKCQ
jgi:hypothetical protein